jgi:hypothetical protein
MSKSLFEFVELPYCGGRTAEAARKLLPFYHCVFVPCVDESLTDSMLSQGFYYRSSATSQDLPLRDFKTVEHCLGTLGAKRRNDILQAVRKAENYGIEVSIDLFRRSPAEFREVYSWYFDIYRPYASTHFPNNYKAQFIDDLHSDVFQTYRRRPFVFATAKWEGKLIGGSFLRHLTWAEYRLKSSCDAAWPDAPGQGDALQMFMLNSGHEPVGNINTYIYYRLVDWCIRQGYGYFSFGAENIMMPPEEYLNVMGSKRAWGTTTVLRYDGEKRFILCNRKALLYLRSDYFVFHRDADSYRLVYFANDRDVPKVLSQWLSGDGYIAKSVFTRDHSVFTYLEKRAQRWNNARLILCDAEGSEELAVVCPQHARGSLQGRSPEAE